jgi:telomere length regulation protein
MTSPVHAQVLLLSAGYVHRLSSLKLNMLLKSSGYLSMMSSRIGITQLRARFLGMVVGETLSGLVDRGDKRLNFHMEETETAEAKWYKSLVNVSDQVGDVESLISKSHQANSVSVPKPSKAKQPKSQPKSQPKPNVKAKSSVPKPGFIIEEIDDESDEDDIVPYAKPDSDPEDSDDDPTLIAKAKPKAPVYIRDLIAYFRDVDNYDKQKLALHTAPTLIRRKANFGTEISSHAVELAGLLVGLQDKFDLDEFHELRLQGMIALITAQPREMGPWFAKTFFDGDYSISQRASILVVLGLAVRELAGFDQSEFSSTASFPSKKLPDGMERMYIDDSKVAKQLPSASLKALPPNALDKIADGLTTRFLAPIAAGAADSITGPDALKLSSFTSRLQGKETAVSRSRPRTRAIPNTTASIISTSFFFPLTARFQHALRASARSSGVIFQPYLLATYLKTLAVLVHAAGPSTLSLPQMTSELWDLLLGIRGHAVGEVTVTHAVLMALAALLDVNEGRMREICESLGREVVETQEWVAVVFERTRGEDGGASEENEVKMLAAGVLIKLREAVDKYRLLLMGDMIDFA